MRQKKVYLAGRYSRRRELLGYADELEALGHIVTSRWLRGEHEAKDATATRLEMAEWAIDDINDITRARTLIAFTDADGGGRGGRHFEFGYALGIKRRVMVVGPIEMLFYAIGYPLLEHYETWPEALAQFRDPR